MFSAVKSFPASRQLSQNFLIDPNWIHKIGRAVGEPLPGGLTIEVGPGLGTLTRALLERGHHVHAIEIDTRLRGSLEALQQEFPTQLTLIFGDALDVTLPCGRDCRFVSNLPYHIASPLLIRLLQLPFATLTLMLQKEMAHRLVAPIDTKAYGRLSIFVQLLAQVAYMGTLGAQLFWPRPTVDSALVHMQMKRPPLPPSLFKHLEQVLFHAFSQRRKMLRTSLGSFLPCSLWSPWLEPTKRAENVTAEQYLELAHLKESLCPSLLLNG